MFSQSTGRYFKVFGREFFIERTQHRPAGLYQITQDSPTERELFAFGYRVAISG